MNLRSILVFASIFGACTLIVSCMTPSQQFAALDVLDRLEQAEVGLTPEQFAELRESILAAGTANFWQQLLGNATSIGLSLLGVRATRGPSATQDERQSRRLARKRR
jgi:hypothetical protein